MLLDLVLKQLAGEDETEVEDEIVTDPGNW